jgi:hypothetical protein
MVGNVVGKPGGQGAFDVVGNDREMCGFHEARNRSRLSFDAEAGRSQA